MFYKVFLETEMSFESSSQRYGLPDTVGWEKLLDPQTKSRENTDVAYAQWQVDRTLRLAVEGRSPDPVEDNNRIAASFRRVMDAYLCHVELDSLATCGYKNNIIEAGNGPPKIGADKMKWKTYCDGPYRKYQACVESGEKQSTLVQAITANKRCAKDRERMQLCVERNLDHPALRPNSVLTDQSHLPCHPEHRGLMRCGLNNLWNDYMRAINGVGEDEDFLSFRVNADSTTRSHLESFAKEKGMSLTPP